MQLVKGENTLNLTGQKLSSGLIKSDYKVTLKSALQNIDCIVIELSDSKLSCTFNAVASKLFGDESKEASAAVVVSLDHSIIFKV